MANTTNFNWETPDDTDLVKDGAAAIRTLGSAIDTSLVDLKGGTTGQILSKATNTDMDFTWITNDVGDITAVNVTSPITGGGTSGAVTVSIQDGTTAQKGAVQLENSTSSTSTTTAAVPASVKSAYDLANAAIPKSLIDAKGDLIVGSANDTAAILSVGTNTHVLTADSSATYGVKWAAAAGGDLVLVKSQTIGTSVTTVTVSNAFSATYDAYKIIISGGTSAADALIELTLGASTSTYYQAIAGVNYSSASVTGRTVNNGSSWLRSGVESGSNGLYMDCTLVNPYLAKWTYFGANFPYSNEGSYASGYHATATSYTDFKLTAGSAMTGGEIRVYGYKV